MKRRMHIIADILVEALPYIRKFTGKTVVVKYGGSAMIDPSLSAKVMQDIILMQYVGIIPVIVHGGGKHISEISLRMGVESAFLNGLRVTDAETMKITQMVLAGLVNKDIVSQLEQMGAKACGLSGKDGNMIRAKRKVGKQGEDYGLVGEITEVDVSLIKTLQEKHFIPVISPLGSGPDGESLNINADVAAARIAQALNAEKIVFLTDVNGILTDKNDSATLVRNLTPSAAEELIKTGVIAGGMIPKIESCIAALRNGVRKVHILNGTAEHALLLETFTDEGIGTEIAAR